ncbi:hypothetical protein HFO55_01515 [Rhizobium leguminosarum]|uniref:hypothetical protein n=1 Tax=Rhizobium leguminosarum TaxID=384 RepID=UPI001C9776B5|nr:hypothetical protein [Rhizobium leguminosarum]MBY5565940.1 hypothetical protein [Rhizobium leguminosarum]MBY5573080.1 hypothetical protein [Rhizobium leguminosarum]
MATDDVSKHVMSCPCGKSTVTFTATSPDHAYVRESQTHHDAEIDCVECREKYVPYAEPFSNSVPAIVLRQQVAAKAAAEQRYWAYWNEIRASPEADRLRPRIVERVDAAKSKAEAHRMLQSMKLTYDSYSTYAKRPYGGEAAANGAGGADLARIGSSTLGGDDRPYFQNASIQLEELNNAWRGSLIEPMALRPTRPPIRK